MNVTAVDVIADGSGMRRGRICRRDDGRYQYVTETLTDGAGTCLPYWTNDHPPSGIFDRRDEATEALAAELLAATRLEGADPVSFDLSIGPYPEPTFSKASRAAPGPPAA
jgi:hypothetical protein